MHTKVSKKELVDKLGKILTLSSSKMDVLNNFIFTVSEEKSFIYATDTETAVKLPLNCKIINEGSVCIPTKRFYEVVKELSDEIEIENKDKWIYIVSGKTQIKIATYPAEEYPVWEEKNYSFNVDINPEELESLIEKTLFASGDFDTRYVLNSLLFHIVPEKIIVIGTDGHRLSMATVNNNHGIQEELKLLVPKKSALLLRKFIKDCESLKMFFSDRDIKFQSENFEFSVRLYEGNYPDYTMVIPKTNDKVASINKNTLVSAVKRVSTISLDNEIVNPIVLQFAEDTVEIECKTPDVGEAKETVSLKYEGENFLIGLNSKYLIDAISCVSTDDVQLLMGENEKPVYIKELGSNGKVNYEHILMPVRL